MSTWTPGYTASRLDIEGLGEHALLHPMPGPCKLTAHWIIARSRLLALAPEMAEVLRDCLLSMDSNDGDSLANAAEQARALLARLEGK